jgi:hypothetical protein
VRVVPKDVGTLMEIQRLRDLLVRSADAIEALTDESRSALYRRLLEDIERELAAT